jgi:hypothetical protein
MAVGRRGIKEKEEVRGICLVLADGRCVGGLPSASLKVARGVMSRIKGRTAWVSPLGRARTAGRRVRAAMVNFILEDVVELCFSERGWESPGG